jgi:hypothetical protein
MPRCQSCNQSADSLKQCNWDASLQVGPCCEVHEDEVIYFPSEPVCAEELDFILASRTLSELLAAIHQHRNSCPVCLKFYGGELKPLWAEEPRRGIEAVTRTSDDPARQLKRAA